jgi:hypothetical protein
MSDEQISEVLSGSPMHFYVTYIDQHIDTKNATYPFRPYLRTDDFTLPPLALYRYTNYLKKVIIHSDFGYIFEDNYQTSSYQIDHTESTILLGSSLYLGAFGQISFLLNDLADVHYRSYSKIQSLLANIGGVINSLCLLGRFIVWYVTYKTMLIKYLNDRISTPEKGNVTNQSTINVSTIKFNTTIGQNSVNVYKKHQFDSLVKKQKVIVPTWKDILLPIRFSSQSDTYRKIEAYLRSKLSCDYLLKQNDDLDRLKFYLFSKEECYFFNHMDKFKNPILCEKYSYNDFDSNMFRTYYYIALKNDKFTRLLE